MSFTRVFRQSKRREQKCIGFKLQTAEKLSNNEEGYKIQTTRCLFFKKKDVKVEWEEAFDSQGGSTSENTEVKP
jgi:hypothetical protein